MKMSITVRQRAEQLYVVVRLVNCVLVNVGQKLSKKQVAGLVVKGIRVNVV